MNNGYPIKEYQQPVKRYCQTMDLKDDPQLIAEYRRRHSEPEAWKEILDGIRSVGILEMEIYSWQPSVHDCRDPTRLRLGFCDETTRHPTPPAGMGRLYGIVPAMP